MVMDGSRAMRLLLGRILRELGFDVVEATEGREGLEWLRKQRAVQPFDLVLLERNLPDVDGCEWVRALRGDDLLRDVPVVMVTSETETAQVAQALAAGVSEYVMKPFTKDVIVEKLAILGLSVG
jgi:two-component system chemotaxis response regulator CheY